MKKLHSFTAAQLHSYTAAQLHSLIAAQRLVLLCGFAAVQLCSYFPAMRAHASFNVTVRLKTIASGVESGSTQKYPRRSNW